jgi:hypothetical protein
MLRGCGAMLGLPLLEAMIPRAHATGPIPQRLLVFFTPNGTYMPDFVPQGFGSSYSLSSILTPLAAMQDDLLVVSGVRSHPTDGEPHASALGAMLTGTFVSAQPNTADPLAASISFDQVAAAHLGTTTRLPSLELGSEGTFLCRFAGGAESYCPYLNHISWSSPTTPRAKEVSARRAFERLFSDVIGGDEATRTKRLRQQRSVLDAVLADVSDLEAILGREDRARLDDYLTGVRELEQRLERSETALSPECHTSAADLWTHITNNPTLDATEHIDLMVDLMVLALRCDATRVITYMLGNGRSERPFPFLGIPDAHHLISHHHEDPDRLSELRTIGQWTMTRFARLLQGLGAVQEFDGSRLLDHTAVMMLNGFGDSDEHDTSTIPLVLAGRGAGLVPGRHLQIDGDPMISRVHLTLLQGLGVNVSSFGGENQPLPALTQA